MDLTPLNAIVPSRLLTIVYVDMGELATLVTFYCVTSYRFYPSELLDLP